MSHFASCTVSRAVANPSCGTRKNVCIKPIVRSLGIASGFSDATHTPFTLRTITSALHSACRRTKLAPGRGFRLVMRLLYPRETGVVALELFFNE